MTDYNIYGYIVYNAETDSVYSFDADDVDEVQLDKTGDWLWIKTDNQGAGVIQTQILNLNTGTIVDLTDNEPDYAPGHGDAGHEFIIGADNWENRLLYRTCEDAHTFYSVWNFESDWNQDVHVSLLADNENWMLISCYLAIDDFPFSGLIENEILQVSTDGKMNVRRLCHHQSNYLISGDNYWASPRASISRDGRFVIFTSNWGNPDRTDVFLLKIPAAPGGEETEISSQQINLDEMYVFPNPANKEIHIDLPVGYNSIYVLNEVGEQFEFIFTDNKADITHLPAGVYFIRIVTDDNQFICKMVKQQ
jgi:hypothetical protein